MRDSFLMNRTAATRMITAGVAALLSVGLGSAADAPTAPSVTALLCGHLIDTAAGKVLGESTIVIEAGHVRARQRST